jgi:hypothetical protein
MILGRSCLKATPDPRLKAGAWGREYVDSALRDESRSFLKAEGFNPQGCLILTEG